MSKFVNQISGVFPGVSWQGQSGIHVSVCGGGLMSIPFSERGTILKVLHEKNVGNAIWQFLMARFSKMEFLMEGDTFSKLFLVDVDRNLRGLPTSESPDRIKNPATGNVFHRIALLPPYVGGVRFWAEDFFGDTHIGFRFRIVGGVDESEEIDIREESREREAQVLVDVQSVMSTIFEVAEPPKVAVEAAEKLLAVIKA